MPKTKVITSSWFLKLRNNALAYTIFYAIGTTMYYIYWGAIFTVVSTIEKRYSFSSTQSGVILSGPEYGRVIALIPMSYLGGRSHIPRITATSLILNGCVMVLFLSPHFTLTPTTSYSGSSNGNHEFQTNLSSADTASFLCHLHSQENRTQSFLTQQTNSSVEADSHQAYVSNTAFTIFVLSLTLLGVCASPLTNISQTYIDMNTSSRNLPLYMGIANCSISIGPMIGAFLSAWASTIYVDLSNPPIQVGHPSWVGAWWICMVAVAVGAATCGPFLFMFPRKMVKNTKDQASNLETLKHLENRSTPKEQKSDNDENNTNPLETVVDENTKENSTMLHTTKTETENESQSLKVETTPKDFVRTMWRIISNPIFVSLTLSRLTSDIAIWGYYAFLTKYIEVHFAKAVSTANIIAGVAILSVGIGNVIAGSLIKFLQLSYRRTAQALALVSALMFVNLIILIFIKCPDVQYAERY